MDNVFENWHFGTEHMGIGILIWVAILIAVFLFYKAVKGKGDDRKSNEDDPN